MLLQTKNWTKHNRNARRSHTNEYPHKLFPDRFRHRFHHRLHPRFWQPIPRYSFGKIHDRRVTDLE
jgi:hypothetical protein